MGDPGWFQRSVFAMTRPHYIAAKPAADGIHLPLLSFMVDLFHCGVVNCMLTLIPGNSSQCFPDFWF